MFAKVRPERIPARLVLWVMQLASALFRVPKKTVQAHYEENVRLWGELKSSVLTQGYIDRQEALGSMLYGVNRPALSRGLLGGRALNGAENTCEVIAVYNALTALGERDIDLPELLRIFESGGISLMGYFGTSIYALRRFFKKRGYTVRALVGRAARDGALDDLSARGAVFVAVMFNSRDRLYDMVHTVCIAPKDGELRVYNSGGGGEYHTLRDAIGDYNGASGIPIAVFAVR
ncbi:MAG: hypothetical protein IJ072_06880 [Oscillospiraceae bacterium]|nr:hypothetical protein [Oscillospiraceae bacterium]